MKSLNKNRDLHFNNEDKLISSTNLEGVIQHCNDAFEKISGYTYEELIGSHHNIVRHPDVPKEVFKVMWKNLKAGVPWMGIIKNRCKNGDYYWVSAYVTPLTENGEIVGYESVRSCPSRADVERAEKLYKRINNKRRNLALPRYLKQLMIAFGFILPALFLGYSVSLLFSTLWLISALLIFGGIQYLQFRHDLILISQELKGTFMHPLAASTYTNQQGMIGNIMVGVMSLRAHLDTVLIRIEDASRKVAKQSQHGLELTEVVRKEMLNQNQQTELVAAAMHEMSLAINEISNNVQSTAVQADHSAELAEQGVQVANVTRTSIEDLRKTVLNIGKSVQRLAEQTNTISNAAISIETISEQTNLLALNAAIEAARAGEQGRGFAVVADEVRLLASNTRDSAQSISHIVANLQSQALDSVQYTEVGASDSDQGLKRVLESETMLTGIVEAVTKISSMSLQMATAVEQQAMVSQDVNRQIAEISALSSYSLQRTEESAISLKKSKEVSEQLLELVNRFKA